MGDIDRQTHICKMKAITQPDQRQSHYVMAHQFFKVLPRLLEKEHQHNCLLRPIAGLKQVIDLEKPLMRAMRVCLEHSSSIEIPDRSPGHDVKTKWSEDREVHGSVDLLHEARLLGAGANATVYCKRPDHPLHQEFASE